MAWTFNPFTGSFDQKGSGGGGGSAFFAGEVATYADLPLDGTAPLNSRWLVRSNSGTWPFSTYKQAGVYVRTATVGSSRDNDYTLTDTSFHDVMSDAAFVIYDDGAPTRSMQVEITDNETLTFKVTGTDSVVRSVAFALSAIVLAALMASSALAQNVGLVTDTNGNIVTRRTNTLVWSNNLRFNPLTNANSRTAIIGTNGALTAGDPPSGAAANGALLTADGAGNSSFVASRVQRVTMTNNFSVTNTTDLTVTNGNVPTMTVDLEANSLYVARWSVLLTCGAEGAKLEATVGAGTNGIINQSVAGRLGRPSFSYGDTYFLVAGGRQVMSLIGFNGAGFTSGVTNGVFNGIAQFRTGASNTTLFWRFSQNSASNVATTLLSNSIFYVEKLSP
jgi:hypothetical protein